ncbi:MAG: 2,3,4,5-tetrahydropyridine-2,6-dicarboxylate N-succinyltransferase [Pseudomonadota bacterium]
MHVNTESLATTINAAWDQRQTLAAGDATLTPIVADVLAALNSGELRVAEPAADAWHVNEWVKKAVLLSFRLSENRVSSAGEHRYFDKVPLKYSDYDTERFAAEGARIVPGAVVRHGSYVASDAVVMPSYINIGAYVGAGTMVDTWATVGSCAQIGANVHLSGGVGIGGVLEPIQAAPTIIEDDCFIGARSEIVEGVVVEKGAVISMGVYIGQSTRIYDRESGSISYGRVPSGSVVVPGSLPASDGSHSLYAAIIVKRVDEKTRAKTDLNDLLRPTE